jgi:hypothetical protein
LSRLRIAAVLLLALCLADAALAAGGDVCLVDETQGAPSS